ncbi:lipid-A-disaccharide synthase [Pigmentibacter ruber]|uniref:lipid-A-disaccharide synthase n=1 Tax=Pigmentibacter ruber TaxID=2683196 RepID=UPI00131C7412|nr:lipid-A-disaccharide synthase [Pigmentibacter ruber]
MSYIQKGGICVVAGEASGDIQASLLIEALNAESAKKNLTRFHFWGSAGPHMRNLGVEDIVKVEDLAVFGLTEIISHYSLISNAYKKILKEIIVRKPIAVILIDYPGFNLKLLQDIYALGITVIYHIPPKAWSHGKKRTEILREYTHLVTSILPFETNFFNDNKVNTVFVGNPLKDNVDHYLKEHQVKKIPFRIGILPGSRKSEIKTLLPLLVESFIELKKIEPKVTGDLPIAPTLNPNFVKSIVYNTAQKFGFNQQWINDNITFGVGNAYDVMARSSYAWVCSGTATLETAFFNTPMSVFYKLAPLTAYVAKKVIKVKYVSLVNLSENKEIIPEYLQENATTENLVSHALKVFNDEQYAKNILQGLEKVRKTFPPNAAQNAAIAILDCIEKYNVNSELKFKLHHEHRIR